MKRVSMLFLVSLFVCQLAFAEGNGRACRADVEKYCPDVKPGGGRIAACLKEHGASLSAECKQFGDRARARLQGFATACAADIKTHCAGVQAGGGRIYRCLQQHEAQLAANCRDQLQAGKK